MHLSAAVRETQQLEIQQLLEMIDPLAVGEYLIPSLLIGYLLVINFNNGQSPLRSRFSQLQTSNIRGFPSLLMFDDNGGYPNGISHWSTPGMG